MYLPRVVTRGGPWFKSRALHRYKWGLKEMKSPAFCVTKTNLYFKKMKIDFASFPSSTCMLVRSHARCLAPWRDG